jgi:Domain of unknown function (DUF4124)
MRLSCRLLASMLLIAWSLTVAADSDTVYKTVGEDGVVSYSDTPPALGQAATTLVFEQPASLSDDEYQQRMDNLRRSTDRMERSRKERESDRLEQHQYVASPVAQQPPAQVEIYNRYYPTSSYSRNPYYRPRPPLRPVHPIEPVAQEGSRLRGMANNAQLMRPISASSRRVN